LKASSEFNFSKPGSN